MIPPRDHRRLARFSPPFSIPLDGGSTSSDDSGSGPTSSAAQPSSTPGDNGNGGGNGDGQQTSQSQQTSSQTPDNNGSGDNGKHSSTASSTQTTPSTTSTTPSTTSTTQSSTQPSTTSTTSSTTSVTVSSVSSTTHSTSKSTALAANTATHSTTKALGDALNTGSQTTVDTAASISSTSSPSGASSSVNVGAIIGGTAGGILAVALIFFVVMAIIRRRRRNEEDFDPASFRNSAVMVNDSGPDPFNPRPPTMIERHINGHNVAPSISSIGANMAGAGAYSAHGHGDEQYANEQQYAAANYPGHQPIQPQQQYTYGQSYAHETYDQQGSDHGHGAEYNGAYSSEPQAQDIYAAEQYAYPVVSPGMEAQDLTYGDYSAHYQQHADDAYGGM